MDGSNHATHHANKSGSKHASNRGTKRHAILRHGISRRATNHATRRRRRAISLATAAKAAPARRSVVAARARPVKLSDAATRPARHHARRWRPAKLLAVVVMKRQAVVAMRRARVLIALEAGAMPPLAGARPLREDAIPLGEDAGGRRTGSSASGNSRIAKRRCGTN
jgi:hypothetical protein